MDPTQQQNNQQQQTQFQGGPGMEGDPNAQSQQQTQQDPSAQTQQQSQGDQQIYLGGRVFKSTAELAAYTQQLETKVAAQPQQPQQTAMQNANQPKPEELMFSDPAAYHQLVKEDAVNEALAIIDKRESQKTMWSSFFGKFSDLKDHESLVKVKLEEIKKEDPNLPAQQALDKVGVEVRSYIARIKGGAQGGTALPTTPAVVAGVGYGAAPTQPAAATSKDESFVSQVKRFQKRGK